VRRGTLDHASCQESGTGAKRLKPKLVLDERPTHTARADRFLEELEDHMSKDYADRTLKSAVNWGRYGELFAYDETSETFSLENPQ
jgi:NitT/TauT family transport system ATP-binding protein